MSRKRKGRRKKQQQREKLPELAEVSPEVIERLDSADIPQSLKSAIESGDISRVAEVAISSISYSSGPIPNPEELKGYNEIVPGAAERIMDWAEEESNHRRGIENNQSGAFIKHRGRGQIMAFVIALAAIGTGGLIAALGQPWAGGSIAVTTVLAIGGISLLSKSRPG